MSQLPSVWLEYSVTFEGIKHVGTVLQLEDESKECASGLYSISIIHRIIYAHALA